MKDTTAKQLLQDIRAAFSEAANPANAAPMQAYMKDIAPFFGIKSPDRKVAEREIFAATKAMSFEQVADVVQELYREPERELHYLAMDWLYSRRKQWTAKTGELIEALITTKSWWDTVDFLATRCLGEWVRRFPEEGAKAVARYIHSGDLWLERSAILHQLNYGSDTDTTLLTETILPHIGSKEFFHRKAIGWALRQYARTDADWVREFVTMHPLSGLSQREAMKHL